MEGMKYAQRSVDGTWYMESNFEFKYALKNEVRMRYDDIASSDSRNVLSW